LALAATPGCGEARLDEPTKPILTVDEAATAFDASDCGTISGRVVWKDNVPSVAPLKSPANPLGGEILRKLQVRPNPNAPVIDPRTKGVGNAVVFLRGVDPKRGRRWHHPPVRVEMRDCQFHLRQGEIDSRFGFVHRGDLVEMVSRDAWLHCLHADGSSFFSYAFPDPDQPLGRRLTQNGIVELTSAAGCFWMRAYLFVDDHPYYARTDAQGRFDLPDVPAGRYEIVCWMPNWRKARHERDPESGLICRFFFKEPVECVRAMTVKRRETQRADFALSEELFGQ
jgi:hypothetical protein